MLYRCELKKSLVTYQGAWILAVCLLLKLALLCAFPEQKDPRILLSQKQYDNYLTQLYGENTRAKSDWILGERQHIKDVLDREEAMWERYARGELSEAEWDAYGEELRLARLHRNAVEIFGEKADQFSAQPEDIPPAHYIYEYGWQTVFTLLRFPDIFLLSAILLLTAQSFPAEAAGGMLPILLAARDGRGRLYRAKLLALLTIGLGGWLVSGGLEVAVFLLRGWCDDAAAPLYSVTALTDSALHLSLGQGYALCLGVRLLAVLLVTALLFGLSVWVRSATNLIFLGLCLLGLPLLWDGGAMLYTHGGLLSGTRMLLWLGDSVGNLLLPLAVVAAYSVAGSVLAARHHARGL